ncbi:MAG: Fic family protein [Candidatus Nanopelagicales bacterium]
MPRTFDALVYSSETDKDVIARAVRAGRLVRLASGIYTSQLDREPADVVRTYLWSIVGHALPGAVIVDRSARDGGLGADGYLYVAAARTRPLVLPGVTVVPRSGAGPLTGDGALPGGLFMSGEARSLLDNLTRGRSTATGSSRKLSRAEVEAWIDSLCAQRGEQGLNRLRDQARGLAPALGAHKPLAVLDALISAALMTRDRVSLVSEQLRARHAGSAFDQQRVIALARLAEYLTSHAPEAIPALPEDAGRRTLLPFYEAYFSNYIEGTEFTLDEAAEIVFGHTIPQSRPADAHDIMGTYAVTSSGALMSERPESAARLIEMLRERHAIVLGGRPSAWPGAFKKRANRAGSTDFVAPDLVQGTLTRGFEEAGGLRSPFARAVFLMFLVTEVHPFTDGNGRVARLMMNSELVSAGEVPLIVPTVYRLNYLSALKAATHTQNYQALVAALSFARRWTARIDFTSRDSAEGDLERTHALRDAREAEDAGVRLTLP